MTQLAPTHRPCCGLLQALPLPAAPAPVLGQPPGSNDTLEALAEAGSFFDLTRMPAAWANPYTSVVLRCPEERRLLNFTRRLPPSARRQSFVSEKELSLPITFPQASLAKAELESCPVVTQLHAAAGAKRCEALRQMANIVQMHQRSAWSATFKQRYGVEVDEFREVLELLKEHQETNADGSEDDDASD
ncbi:Hypothetical protein SCF082_LOCUS24335 [Durusdinium trenchii]|uniref:Uncharacterized protein n=1 Tax=Durusdinium trenchii TaxID=1381693 RepID=A0ABP0LSS3_9DINO